MASFDEELNRLVNDWLKRGADPQSMKKELGAHSARMWARIYQRNLRNKD